MKTSQKGLELIRSFEGCMLKLYKDVAGLWTIGIGHLVKAGEDFSAGITLDRAMEILADDLKEAEDAVTRLVKVALTQDQFDALVSLVFNIGAGAFERSTLLVKLNLGDYEGAALEFLKWVKAGGKEVPGLARRRNAERRLFECQTT